MRVISIRLPKWMLDSLDLICSIENVSRSEIIRRSLAWLLMKYKIKPNPELRIPPKRKPTKNKPTNDNIMPSCIKPLVAFLLKHGCKIKKIENGRYIVTVNGNKYYIKRESPNRWQVYVGDKWIVGAYTLKSAIVKAVQHSTGLWVI